MYYLCILLLFTAQLICIFVFAYVKSRFSHDAALIMLSNSMDPKKKRCCVTGCRIKQKHLDLNLKSTKLTKVIQNNSNNKVPVSPPLFSLQTGGNWKLLYQSMTVNQLVLLQIVTNCGDKLQYKMLNLTHTDWCALITKSFFHYHLFHYANIPMHYADIFKICKNDK